MPSSRHLHPQSVSLAVLLLRAGCRKLYSLGRWIRGMLRRHASVLSFVLVSFHQAWCGSDDAFWRAQREPGSFKRGRCRRGRSKIPPLLFLGKLQLSGPAQGKTKKKQKRTKKSEERKNEENSHKPIYTNPFKNFPGGRVSKYSRRTPVGQSKSGF